MPDGVIQRSDRRRREARDEGRVVPDGGTVPADLGGPEPVVDVVVLDAAARAVAKIAERKVRRVLSVAGAPVLYARIKLGLAPDPAVERPASAEVTVDVNGQLVRAHVAAHALREAVDLLESRLRARLEHRSEQLETIRRRGRAGAGRGGWRHAQPVGERPLWTDRPPEDREVVRRKTFSVGDATIDEAAFDMEMLGHDFHLFRELATGLDGLVHRRPDGAYGLRRMRRSPIEATAAVEAQLEPSTAPPLSLTEALEWLNLTDEPFLFFADPASGRANVAYRRYDGHYGLITPADEPAPAAEPGKARRHLRAELERLDYVRAALRGVGLDIETETASIAELSSLDQHPADLGTETFERERDLSLLDDVEAEIKDVHRALVRIDQGDYGSCEACGRAIPNDRLLAMPATRFCLEHQAGTEVVPGLTP